MGGSEEKALRAYRKYLKKCSILSKEEQRKLTVRLKHIKSELDKLQSRSVLERITSDEDDALEASRREKISRLTSEMYFIRERLIEGMQKLVFAEARTYKKKTGTPLSLLDLVGAGNLGLLKALDRYDPDHIKKASFETYATFWVRQAIAEYINENSLDFVKVPEKAQKEFIKMVKSVEEAAQRKGGYLSDEELEAVLGDKAMGKFMLLSMLRNISSISEPIGEEANSGFHEDFLSEEDFSDKLLEDLENRLMFRDLVLAVREVLRDKEKIVFFFRFILGMSLDRIAQILGVSKERVRQIVSRIVNKLRKYVYSRHGKP